MADLAFAEGDTVRVISDSRTAYGLKHRYVGATGKIIGLDAEDDSYNYRVEIPHEEPFWADVRDLVRVNTDEKEDPEAEPVPFSEAGSLELVPAFNEYGTTWALRFLNDYTGEERTLFIPSGTSQSIDRILTELGIKTR